ncbi:MAG: ribonuclease D [Pseudomonadota bacterium]
MTVHAYERDLPDGLDLGPVVAIDTEAMGLGLHRDRLCVIQMSSGDGDAHVVRVPLDAPTGPQAAPNIARMLADPAVLKLFHFGRFDIAVLAKRLEVVARPVWCTKIASKLVRTYTDRHGLKNLCSELLNVDMSKQQQSSDWGADVLSQQQLDYAASDVLHLHALRAELERRLSREDRLDLAQRCFDFLPDRARLDLAGWPEEDVFAH